MNPSIIASNAASQRSSVQSPVGRRPNIKGCSQPKLDGDSNR
jgi:hypothetical protein